MSKYKLHHVKPSYIDGGDVWHGIDKLPWIGHTIIVERQLKGSDELNYRTEDVCAERTDRFEPTMSFVPKRWAYAADLALCKKIDC